MYRYLIYFILNIFAGACSVPTEEEAPIHWLGTPAPGEVLVNDEFWSPKIELNRVKTIPYVFSQCEQTGRIDNFAIAAEMKEGKFEGIFFNDSDVVKVVEGAAYALQELLSGRFLQIHNSYIVTQTQDGFVIIDQHALHERLTYDSLVADLNNCATRCRSWSIESG